MTTGVSTPTVIYGNESQASLTATVASPGTGTPTGTVTFKNGGTTICTATLANGIGSCTPSATSMPASGTAYSLTATYSGDTNFSAPANQTVNLTVSKATTTATMTVSPTTVTYGSETSVHRHRHRGPPVRRHPDRHRGHQRRRAPPCAPPPP